MIIKETVLNEHNIDELQMKILYHSISKDKKFT